MHDDDESITEAAERIVADELDRYAAQFARALEQVPPLLQAVTAAAEELAQILVPFTEQMKNLLTEIEADQRDTIAFMEDQFDY